VRRERRDVRVDQRLEDDRPIGAEGVVPRRPDLIGRIDENAAQYFATVMSSFIPFICIAPSPTRARTARCGKANFAAMA
jgi:hypothetical protein